MTNANILEHDETTLLDGRVRLLQPMRGLRAGLDAVMLAATCPAKAGERVVDLGCGTGAAGFCVAARVGGISLTGVDIQAPLLEFATRSAALNGWADACKFVQADVRDKTALPMDYFEHGICNPPYLQAGAWAQSPDDIRAKQLGKAAGDALLADWVDCLQRVVKPKGSVSFVHRADHADKLIQALGTRFGGLELMPLYPHGGQEAKRVLIRALKNRKSPMRILPGLVLHEGDEAWSDAAQGVLRDGQAVF